MAAREELLVSGATDEEQSVMGQSPVYLVRLAGRATTMSSVFSSNPGVEGRGPNGRYILIPDAQSHHNSNTPSIHGTSDQELPELVDAADTTSTPQEEQTSRNEGRSSTDTVNMAPSDHDASPTVVGESWYASYVMRGYTPGHTSFHRPIGDCSETVQNVSRDTRRECVSNRTPVSQQKPDLSDLPPPELVDRLIKVYFERFHTFCPILRKKYFFASLQDGSMSATLLRSVLFVASLHCNMEVIHLMGHATRWDANSTLYNKASASFDADKESSRTHMILSSYLLHYWFGSPTAYRDCHWWLAAAIRSAQCTGYHRSTKNSKMSPEERSRWKRIWWCFYVRDRQIAISTGTPMVIHDEDYDVEELAEHDLAEEAPETVQYMIAQVKLMARLYFSHCSPSRLLLCRDASVRQQAMDDIQTTLRTWYDSFQSLNSASNNHHLSLTVKVCYHYYVINLSQRLQRQCANSDEAKAIIDAASQVFNLVENSLLFWTPEHFPMIYVSALFSAMMALAVDVKTTTSKSDQIFVKIRPGLLALKQFESVYILARWIKNFFMDILNRSESNGAVEFQRQGADESNSARSTIEIMDISHQTSDALPTVATSANQPAYQTSGLGVEDSSFMFGGNSDNPYPDVEGNGFWPMYLANGVFTGIQSSDAMEFPQPDSSQYQALYFLADLGIANPDPI
ncbi:hypothetical protein F53441_3600 [Fusarium austroafricanum]|uniref:Xylanolytic transcriptional activator regulatory domain-containing protein n=1 Tax=Fusarium austroafricanum TaxID=2364996 RepID=A0A8H4KQJ7_9HYPO|nr:hypothetical protein F53441_3600 [Fusarium austroafricanum]